MQKSRRVGASLTEDQTPDTLFVPVHWNQQFGAEGKVDGLVTCWRCLYSGQPECKRTPIGIQPWHSTLVICDNVTIRAIDWWCRLPAAPGLMRFSLAQQGDPRRGLQTLLHPAWEVQETGDEQAF